MTMILITCEVLERCLPNVALFEIMVIGLDGYNFFELNMNGGVVIDTWILGSQKFAKYPKKKYPKVSKSIQKYQFLFLFLSINLIH